MGKAESGCCADLIREPVNDGDEQAVSPPNVSVVSCDKVNCVERARAVDASDEAQQRSPKSPSKFEAFRLGSPELELVEVPVSRTVPSASEQSPAISSPGLSREKTPGSRQSKSAWTSTDLEFMIQNGLVAVVGSGARVWELADQRLHERGRLLVLLTDRAPRSRYKDDGEFKWWPPERKKPVGEQARQMVRRYKVRDSRRWVRKGPDIVELKDDEEYEIDEAGHSLRVLVNDMVVWEVSAKTLLADEQAGADCRRHLTISAGCFGVTAIPSAGTFFFASFLWFVCYGVGFCFDDYEKADIPVPFFRALYIAMCSGAYGWVAGNNVYAACAVGIDDVSTKGRVVCFAVGFISYYIVAIIPVGSNTLGSFPACCITCLSVHVCFLCPLHWYRVAQPGFPLKPGEVEPARVRLCGVVVAWPRYWKWFIVSIILSFGPWVMNYLLAAAYVLVNTAGYGKVANVALPIVVTAVEGIFVWIGQVAFGRYVFKVRASGNQMYILSLSACFIHAFAESVKLVATVSGAALCEDNPNGMRYPEPGSCNPYGWIVSTGTGVAITLLSRFGWVRFVLGRVLQAMKLRNVAKAVAPSVASKLHDEAKYYVGYARFVIPLCILLSKVVTGKDAVIFNMPATWCCIASIFVEVVEDVLVGKELLPYPPSPNPRGYMEYDNYDPRQLYTFVSKPQEELESRKSGRSRLMSGVSFAAPAMLRTNGDYFPRALTLHGTRDMTFWELIGATGPICLFSSAGYELLLGAGYVHGVCALPLGDDWLKELILWPLPLDRCMYSTNSVNVTVNVPVNIQVNVTG